LSLNVDQALARNAQLPATAKLGFPMDKNLTLVIQRAKADIMTAKTAFPDIDRIQYEGPESRNPLAFRYYDENRIVEGKTMREHLRFSVVYWHTFRNPLSDPFGAGTAVRPWEDGTDSVENAKNRVRVAFEFMDKLGVPFYAFHDRDVAPEGATLAETNKNLDAITEVLAAQQERTGIGLLWGTANLFSNPRYMHGAATSPNATVFAHAAAQVKKAIEVTHQLGGAGYTFWGGREGYQNLWNTDMSRELAALARLLHMAVDHAKKIGFQGQFYIEPKPKEPTKHQYDFDAASCLNFLRQYELTDYLKLNLETNHATLAGHTMQHELEVAGSAEALGSIDANTGDMLLGWDTDQFPTDIYLTTTCMHSILKYGGLTTGGVNFDAKVRRESFEPVDLFYAHIGGMDAFARGLLIAADIRADGRLESMLRERYASWDEGLGSEIEAGKHDLQSLEAWILERGDASGIRSGHQELIENIINTYL
jgi:xylose isomerase